MLLLTNYSGIGSFLVALIVFAYPIWKWFKVRKQEADARQFDVYHRILKELVDTPTPRVHRQMGAIYELRNFPKYFPISYRIVVSLHTSWSVSHAGHQDILDELILAKKFFEKQSRGGVNLLE